MSSVIQVTSKDHYIIQNKLHGNCFLDSIKSLLNRIRTAVTGRIIIIQPGKEKMSFSTDYSSLSTVDTSFIDYSVKAKKKESCEKCGSEKKEVHYKTNVENSNKLYKFTHEQGLVDSYQDLTYKNVLKSKLPESYFVKIQEEKDDKNKRYIDTILVINKEQIEKLRDGDTSFVSTQKVIKTAHAYIPKGILKGNYDYYHSQKVIKATEQRQAFIFV